MQCALNIYGSHWQCLKLNIFVGKALLLTTLLLKMYLDERSFLFLSYFWNYCDLMHRQLHLLVSRELFIIINKKILKATIVFKLAFATVAFKFDRTQTSNFSYKVSRILTKYTTSCISYYTYYRYKLLVILLKHRPRITLHCI